MKSLNLPKSAFAVKETGKDSHIIYANDINRYNLITKSLTEAEIRFYILTPKGSKPKSILIKGIRGDFSPNDLKNEIEEMKIPNVKILSLSKFVLKKSEPDKYHHIIQLSQNSPTAELLKIKTLAY